jgi:hypothetical protein
MNHNEGGLGSGNPTRSESKAEPENTQMDEGTLTSIHNIFSGTQLVPMLWELTFTVI